jgi:hypothetical protein
MITPVISQMIKTIIIKKVITRTIIIKKAITRHTTA